MLFLVNFKKSVKKMDLAYSKFLLRLLWYTYGQGLIPKIKINSPKSISTAVAFWRTLNWRHFIGTLMPLFYNYCIFP